MKILVAIDGSPQSQAALEKLVEKLAFFRDAPQLILVCVHAPVPYRAAASWVGRDALDRYYSDQSDEALAGAVAFLTSRGIPFVVEKRVGDPAEEIVKLGDAEQCDLIAMGTHGHGALASLVMGSVATKVVALTTVPVLLLR